MNKYNSETVQKLPQVYYGEGTYAFYDSKTDTYYNKSGQELRNPIEYDPYSEGYTPFGDE